jgi:hypothetical protein
VNHVDNWFGAVCCSQEGELDQLDTGRRPQQLGRPIGSSIRARDIEEENGDESKIEMDTATHKPKRPAS